MILVQQKHEHWVPCFLQSYSPIYSELFELVSNPGKITLRRATRQEFLSQSSHLCLQPQLFALERQHLSTTDRTTFMFRNSGMLALRIRLLHVLMTTISHIRLRFCVAATLLLLSAACTKSEHDSSQQGRNDEQFADVASDERFSAGDEVPDILLRDLDGRERSLDEFKGRPVLLNFWATWCAPCIKEMPDLVQLQEQFSPEELTVIGINLDPISKLGEVKRVLERERVKFPVLLDPELTSLEKFGVTGFPETFLIDADGKMTPMYDASLSKRTLRVLSDRPWSSADYIRSIKEALGMETTRTKGTT